MFEPGWNNPTRGGTEAFPKVIAAAPNVVKIVEVSQRIKVLVNMAFLEQLGEEIITYYDGVLHGWVNGQRANTQLGGLPQYAKRLDLTGLTAVYTYNQGQEMLGLVAYPENFPATAQQLPMGDIFDINVPFTGWPILGWQFAQAGLPHGWIDPQNLPFGGYIYDPQFVPNIPSTPGADMAPGSALFRACQSGGGILDPTVQIMTEVLGYNSYPPTIVDLFDETAVGIPDDSPATHAGYNADWWTRGVGGSGICHQPLSGLQYWEVMIVKLPAAVPPAFTITGDGTAPIFQASTENLEAYNVVHNFGEPVSITWKWPAQLNTWLSPVIGLVPATYRDPSWTKNTIAFGGVIGLDPVPVPVARSIGCVRTSSYLGDGGIYLWGDTFWGADTGTDGNGNPIGYLNQPGRKTPVLKGRGDALASLLHPSQDVAIGNTANVSGNPARLANGVWTGVDLGELAEKDTVMLAADTKSRKVWFGKNGKWYGTSGPTTFAPGSPHLPAATFMDGDDKVLYYPACSFRVGPTHLRMLFGTTQQYLPPAGFSSYGSPGGQVNSAPGDATSGVNPVFG